MQEALERQLKDYEANTSPQMQEIYECQRKELERERKTAEYDKKPTQMQVTFESQHKNDSYPFGFFFFFDDLNEEGQQEALKRVEELTHIPKYQKKKD